jgi:hypothetical protein
MGVFLGAQPLPLYRGRDYRRVLVAKDPVTRQPVPFPAGSLFIELCNGQVWHAAISGANAVFKVESEVCDVIPDGMKYQLVWMPRDEPAQRGGTAVGWGRVKVVTGCP